MTEKKVYVANDGAQFNRPEECLAYECYLNKTNEIMSKLKPRKDEEGYAVRQDIDTVKQTMKDFFDNVGKPLVGWDLAKRMMDDTAKGIRHISHIVRLFSELPEYPVLSNTFYRFTCISMQSGIEYEQPYYASHENEFKGVVE